MASTNTFAAFVATLSAEQQAVLSPYVALYGAYEAGQAAAEVGSTPKPPKAGTITGRVWEVCNDLASKGEVKRAEVLKALPDVNYHTVTTQYGHWRTWHKAQAAAAAAAKAQAEAQAKAAGEEQAEAGVGGA